MQHTSRHIEVIIEQRVGKAHFHGIYAPHDKIEEEKKSAFWSKLEEIYQATPLPEPVYILGDFNVRLHGRLPHEHDHIGPHIQGKGPRYINTNEDSNRQFFVNFLKTTASRGTSSLSGSLT